MRRHSHLDRTVRRFAGPMGIVAGAPASSDIDQTALAGRWRPSRAESCWSDNGVTPAVAGGLLYRVDDEVGTDHLLQSTAGNRPTLTANVSPSGHQGLTFASTKYLATAGNISTTDTTYYWVGLLDRAIDSMLFARMVGAGSATEYVYYNTASDGAASDTVATTRGTARTVAPAAGSLPTKSISVVALVVKSGTDSRLYVNGVLKATTAGSPGVTALTAQLGLNVYSTASPVSFSGNQWCQEMALYSVAHDASKVAATSAILQSKYTTLAADFSLADLPSGVLVFAHELRSAAAVGAVADGARVGSWTDSGPAADPATSSGTNRPIYRAPMHGGRPLLEFDVDDLEDRFLAGSVGRSFTHAFLVAKFRKPNVNRDASAAGPATFDQYRGAAGLNGWDGIANSTGKPSMIFTGAVGMSNWFDFYVNAGWRLDGAASQSAGASRMAHLYETWRNSGAPFRDYAVALGRDRNVTGANARWRGDVRAFIGLLSPTPPVLANIRAYLAWYQQGPIVAHAGDSLRAGYGVLTTECDAALLDAAYHGTVDCPNFAVPGQGLSVSTAGVLTTMLGNDAALLDGLPAGRSAAVLAVQAGTNDAALGHSDTVVVTDLWTYCDGRRAAGWKVLVFTLTDRTDTATIGNQSAFDTKRAAINSAIRAGWAAHADALIDLAADARLGANGASANTTYFHPTDRVHLSATSYSTIVLPLMQAAVETLIPA